MHRGNVKIWYSISHDQKEKMDEYIKRKYFATLLKQPDLVHRLTVHIDPLELMKHGIKVYRVVQKPGEIIVTLPKGYHLGFSTGYNVAEAVNFSVYINLRLDN
jgi:histone demethylase JARID1